MAFNHQFARVFLLHPVLLTALAACSGPTGPSPLNPGGPDPDAARCAAFSDSRSAAYALPYDSGQRFKVTKTFGHETPMNGGVGRYAIDIDMPMRTPVRAIRSGTVVAVQEAFSDNDHAVYHENWVMVRHADNTVARYIHLTQNGAPVEVGEAVEQGQLVGFSGNSGDSSAPHLHFDVQTCGPNLPPGYNDAPCGMTVPLSFRNTEPQTCGLEAGRSYTAASFMPDLR